MEPLSNHRHAECPIEMTQGLRLVMLVAIVFAAQTPRRTCAQIDGTSRYNSVPQNSLEAPVANGGPDRTPFPAASPPNESFRRLPMVIDQTSVREPPPAVNVTSFPALPPDPNQDEASPLPPLAYELWQHGGSYLYAPEGDRLNWPDPASGAHYQVLRLPETWCAPQPFTLFDDFLGSGPIPYGPKMRWPGGGFNWDPRFVLYGGYELFGIALEENGNRHDLIGNQLLLDVDFRLTGTERVHAQWRPVGEGNSGGSYYQFNDPSGYVDNSSAIPERYWVEWEMASLLSGKIKNPFVPRDYHVVVGKFPFVLQNRLLMNDDILGVVVNKNNIYSKKFSNLNVQAFLGLDDVDAYTDGSASLAGVNVSADWRHVFFEASYAYVHHRRQKDRSSNYLALGVTKPIGARMISGRAMFKSGDQAGRGSGALFVLESSKTRIYHDGWFGIHKGVYYATAFHATDGWNSISGGNFSRLRLAFTVDPVILVSAARDPGANTGVAAGVQFFRHHEDESLVPEIAFDSPEGAEVWGVGLRYQRKTGPRSFFEIQGVENFSDDSRFRREGVSISETILF